MRVLFHTPLKPPDHPVPSGDREMARGLSRLLARLDHKVIMPAGSRVAQGCPDRKSTSRPNGAAQTGRAPVARWRALPAHHRRFDLWFLSLLYRKPDWRGRW